MNTLSNPKPDFANGVIRVVLAHEMPLLTEHLLRLDRNSRHDRFNGYVDDSFIDRYVARSVSDGTIILGYFVDGMVRGAAELHQPDLTPGSMPEIAFSVEPELRRLGVGSKLFKRLIDAARSMGYEKLRITTGGYNDAMRALALKFGANLTFRHGESTGHIDLTPPIDAVAKVGGATPSKPAAAGRRLSSWFDVQGALVDYSRAVWRLSAKSAN